MRDDPGPEPKPEKPEIKELVVLPETLIQMRMKALDHAVTIHGEESPGKVLETAEKFLKFLSHGNVVN